MAMQTVKKGLRLWTPEAEHLENFPGDYRYYNPRVQAYKTLSYGEGGKDPSTGQRYYQSEGELSEIGAGRLAKDPQAKETW